MSTDSEQSRSTGTQEQPATPTVEIDGEQVSFEQIKEWKAGNMRQADYTKKTQELAAQKKTEPSGQEDFDKQVDSLVEALAPKLEARFVSKQDSALDNLIRENPELEDKRKLLQDLGKSTNKAYEDLVDEYNLKPSDALEKSKSREPLGKRKYEKAPDRKLSDLSPEEYAQWKKDNLNKTDQWVSRKL